VVIISGTGSISVGVNRHGKRVYAGGWGPVAGDEGSGSWIARRALQMVARASDGRGPQTALTEAACEYFQVSAVEDLSTAIYAPTITNDRIAGFSRPVIATARTGDEVALGIIDEAGKELGKAAVAVIRKVENGAGSISGSLCRGSVRGRRIDCGSFARTGNARRP
jgi:N-acetylglucosamine kinase-like BadF-type ATPase